jgi:putative flippase GtrA
MSLETRSAPDGLDNRITAPVLDMVVPVHNEEIDRGRPLPVTGVPAGLTGQLLRFAAVGVASTLAYLGLYALLRLGASPQWANFMALLATAIANTAANRRLTFGVRGTDGAWRHQIQGLLVFAVGLGLTSGVLALLGAVSQQPARPVELAALIAANLLATAARFLMLRIWVFRARRATRPAT